MESFRDAQGRPRQRTLANLHGAESADEALARLTASMARLDELCQAVEAEARAAARAAAPLAGRPDASLPLEARIERAALENRGRWLETRGRRLRTALAALEADRGKLEPHRTWDDAKLRRAVVRGGAGRSMPRPRLPSASAWRPSRLSGAGPRATPGCASSAPAPCSTSTA